MAPKIVDREERQAAIALAAVGVFAEKGYQNTRMSDVARAAGIGKGTIYEYFASREELLGYIFDQTFAGFEQQAEALAAPEGPLLDVVLNSAEEMMVQGAEMVDLTPVYFEIFAQQLALSESPLKEKFARAMDKMIRRYGEIIKTGQRNGEFKDDIDPFAAARALLGAGDGIMLHYGMLRPSKKIFNKQITAYKKMIRGMLT